MSDWASTGDDRLLAYENACALHGILTDALNLASASDGGLDLDVAGYTIESVSDVVLGETGTRLGTGRVLFTVRQVIAQAEMLNALLPALAAAAHEARVEHQARRGANGR